MTGKNSQEKNVNLLCQRNTLILLGHPALNTGFKEIIGLTHVVTRKK